MSKRILGTALGASLALAVTLVALRVWIDRGVTATMVIRCVPPMSAQTLMPDITAALLSDATIAYLISLNRPMFGDADSRVIDQIRRGTSIKLEGTSNIRVSFTSPEPVIAKRVVGDLGTFILSARIEKNRLIALPERGPLIETLPISMLEEELALAVLQKAPERQKYWSQAIFNARKMEKAREAERKILGYWEVAQPASDPVPPDVPVGTLSLCAASVGGFFGWIATRTRIRLKPA